MKVNHKIKHAKYNLMIYKILLVISFPIVGLTTVNAQTGKANFDKYCGACHTITSKNSIGPGLAGINEKYSQEWLIKWTHNSQELIAAGDADAIRIFEQYNKVPMPPFPQLNEQEIIDILAYVEEFGGDKVVAATTTGGVVTAENATTGDSPVLGKYGFLIVLFITAIIYVQYRVKRKIKFTLNHMGYHDEDPFKIPNYFLLFIVYFGIAVLLSYGVVYLLEINYGMINELMFIVLPYLAIVVFLIGSAYRYKNRGFQVSSLSSEFLEGNKLFWGSQLFHWSILILFFGHLIAFLFPSAILAWNGKTVRLLILEFSSFAFGLTALLGVVLLVKRRLSMKALKMVANKMDMVVYTVLLVQIISGLGVAFFIRWGSSWFSSVLSPYLSSVFSLNPDISAVAEMPWLIQLHIISAFVIVAIIPFTRFVHFLVAPIDYIWRRYQLVIWNWNPKKIRTSTRWNFGKKPQNH